MPRAQFKHEYPCHRIPVVVNEVRYGCRIFFILEERSQCITSVGEYLKIVTGTHQANAGVNLDTQEVRALPNVESRQHLSKFGGRFEEVLILGRVQCLRVFELYGTMCSGRSRMLGGKLQA